MSHLKCATCRIRIRSQKDPVGDVGELCPGCGSLLEPVQKLSELLGLQERRRESDEAQERSDASRWLDNGGSATPEAVAMALAPLSRDA